MLYFVVNGLKSGDISGLIRFLLNGDYEEIKIWIFVKRAVWDILHWVRACYRKISFALSNSTEGNLKLETEITY